MWRHDNEAAGWEEWEQEEGEEEQEQAGGGAGWCEDGRLCEAGAEEGKCSVAPWPEEEK